MWIGFSNLLLEKVIIFVLSARFGGLFLFKTLPLCGNQKRGFLAALPLKKNFYDIYFSYFCLFAFVRRSLKATSS
jgi:hypothetical protein